MKFNIIENYNPFNGIEIEKFKEDYPRLTNLEISKKYDISPKRVAKLSRELNLPQKHARHIPNPKYYYYDKTYNKWIVRKGTTFYAAVRNDEEAKKVVNFLKEHNWDKELFQKQRSELLKRD